jgi:dihydroorotase
MKFDLLVEDGRIAAVAANLPAAPVDRTIDASGRLVCPGFIDLHTHLREPGYEYKETIESGTLAAARGGFTTVCCMPNTMPAIDSRATVEFVTRTAGEKGYVRMLPVGCVTQQREGKRLAEMAELADAGVVAYSDDGSPVANGAIMRHALEYSRIAGLPVSDHCEDPEIAKGGVMHEGWVATRLGLRGWPAAAETSMVSRDIALAEATGGHIHIAHLSVAGSVDLVRQAKARGVRVTAEVTPHHLTLTDERVLHGSGDGPYDTNAKVNPPLRSPADVEACIAGLNDGTIDCVATDHAPHAIVEKLCEFDDAAFGISNLETALGSVLSLVHGGRLTLETAMHRLTAGPVLAWDLHGRTGETGLGSLSEGAPADIVIIDLDQEWTVEPERFASKGKNSPLRGQRLKGRAVATIAAGRIVHEE